jgi:hypothetical protein
MLTSQLLHRVPSMRPEMHHVLLIAAGALHTILCATKSQLHALSEAPDLLQLQWSWSLHDVLAVCNAMALGAAVASYSGEGNPIPFCSSFAAGLAMRMVFHEASPAALGRWCDGGHSGHMARARRSGLIGSAKWTDRLGEVD